MERGRGSRAPVVVIGPGAVGSPDLVYEGTGHWQAHACWPGLKVGVSDCRYADTASLRERAARYLRVIGFRNDEDIALSFTWSDPRGGYPASHYRLRLEAGEVREIPELLSGVSCKSPFVIRVERVGFGDSERTEDCR